MSQSSRTAIKKFVIDNTSTTLPTGVTIFTAIATARSEPKIEKLGRTVFCEIGETRRRVLRLGSPRGSANKWANWEVDVLVIATATDEQNGADEFQAVFDSIVHSYETVSITPPPTITDPVTGGTSTLFEIGEVFSDVVFRPELTADQGRAVFRGVVTLPITEYIEPD